MITETTEERIKRLICMLSPAYARHPELIGNGDYCFDEVRCIAELAIAEEREACAMVLDDKADRQEIAWNDYLAGSGNKGPASSFHEIPRKYAAQIRAITAAPKDEVSK